MLKRDKNEFEVKIWGKDEEVNVTFHNHGFQTEVLFGLMGAILGYSRRYDVDYKTIKKMLKEMNKNFVKCDIDDLIKMEDKSEQL